VSRSPDRRRIAARLAALAALAATVLAGTVLAGTGRPGTGGSAALAATAVTGPGGWGITPAPGPGGQPRGYFILTVAPGRSARETAMVTNLSKATVRLRVTTSAGVTAANSGSAYEAITGRCAGAACWVSGLPGVLTLAPGTRQLVSFRVRVPAGTRPGQYLAGISAEAATRRHAVQVGRHGHSSAKAIVVDQVTAGLAVTVGRLAGMRTAIRVRRVSAAWIGSTTRLSIGVADGGPTLANATGRISCQAAGQSRSYRVYVDTVLPGGGAEVEVNARGLVAGQVPCTIALRDSAGGRVRWTGTVPVPPRVLTRIYHPAKGVYVALPESTTPAWAIALMVLGALVLGGLAVLLGARYRRAGRRPTLGGGA
jgi:hypothetical protein